MAYDIVPQPTKRRVWRADSSARPPFPQPIGVSRWKILSLAGNGEPSAKALASRTTDSLRSSRIASKKRRTLLSSPVTGRERQVRDLLMDIKKLEQVNSEGLEQWKPVMKGSFPLPLRIEERL